MNIANDNNPNNTFTYFNINLVLLFLCVSSLFSRYSSTSSTLSSSFFRSFFVVFWFVFSRFCRFFHLVFRQIVFSSTQIVVVLRLGVMSTAQSEYPNRCVRFDARVCVKTEKL